MPYDPYAPKLNRQLPRWARPWTAPNGLQAMATPAQGAQVPGLYAGAADDEAQFFGMQGNVSQQPQSPYAGMYSGLANAERSLGLQGGAQLGMASGPSKPRMSQADAWSAYMRTGRNPLLGPNAPYGVFTPGGISDIYARGSQNTYRRRQPAVNPQNGGQSLAGAVQPQNRGLAQGLQDLYDLNQSSPASGQVAPYRPTPGPSGLQTYGGAYGQQAGEPAAPFNPMARQGYPSGGAVPLGMAPDNMAQYDQQMAAQNPGGQLFGGALPTMITSASGQQRPGYMAPPAQIGGTPESIAAANYSLSRKGYAQDPQTGQWSNSLSPNDPQMIAQQQAAAMFDARRGGVGQRQQDYQQRTAADMADRRAGVSGRAIGRADARNRRTGNLTNNEAMQFGIPGFALGNLRAGVERDFLKENARQFGATIGQQNLDRTQKMELAQLEVKQKELQRQHEAAVAAGNNAAALELRKQLGSNQAAVANITGQASVDVATATGVSAERTAEANRKVEMKKAETAERDQQLRQVEAYHSAADKAAELGDYQEEQRLREAANQAMPVAAAANVQSLGMQGGAASVQGGAAGAQQGLRPKSIGELPKRGPLSATALTALGPVAAAQKIRLEMPELTQAEMDALLTSIFPDTTVTQYNQNGIGLSDIIGNFTGLGNLSRGRRAISGRGPQPPKMNIGLGRYNPPIPVIPGMGIMQQYFGW